MVVVIVAVLALVLNIVLAVFIGFAIAIVLFVLYMSQSIVRRSYRCDSIHSRKSRIAPKRALLESVSKRILVIELQGALFFGTGETIANGVEKALKQDTSCIILDLRRLTEIDSTGASIVLELKSDLVRRKTDMLLVAGDQTLAIERLHDFGAVSAFGRADIFPDVDRAIERAEDDLLRAEAQMSIDEIPLHESGLFAGFSPADLNVILSQMAPKHYERDDVVFREGDPGDELLIVTKGTASAYLQLPNGANVRLATFAPGTVFGELAILDRGPRSASVFADSELSCYGFTTAAYIDLAEKAPAVAIQFIAAIGRELSGRLRSANRTIHHLET